MNFELKKWSIDYKNDLIEAFKDGEILKKLPDSYPYPFEEQHAQYYITERIFNSEERQICRAIVADNKVIGGVEIILGTGKFSKTGSLSIWLSKKYRRQGIGSSTVKQLCDTVFNDYGAARVTARVIGYDQITPVFLEYTGFSYEGTIHSAIYENGSFYDYKIYAIINTSK